MKKLFFIIGLFFSLSAAAQPTNYTKINMRYRWLSGMFDSALYVPRYNGTPSGVRVNETSVFDGMVAMDTTNNRLYIYSGGSWVRLANYSEIAAYTAGNGLTLSGSQFKLGGVFDANTELLINDGLNFDINTSVAGIFKIINNGGDTLFMVQGNGFVSLPTLQSGASTDSILTLVGSTGQVRKRRLSEVVTTPTLQQVITAGSTLTKNDTIYLNSYHLRILNNGAEYLVIDPTLNNEYAEFRSYNPTEVNDARLKVNTTNLLSSGQFEADFGDGVNVSRVDVQSSNGVSKVILSAYNDGGGLNESYLYVDLDSIYLRPEKGALNIDSLRTWSGISDTTHKKPMTWDTRNGRWEYAANWYGGGGGGTPSGSNKQVQYNNSGSFGGAAGLEVTNSNIQVRALSQATTDTVLQIKTVASQTGDPFNIVNQNNKRLFAINSSGFPQVYDGAGNTVANFRVNSGVGMEIFNTGGLGMESWGVVRLKGSSLPMVGKMAITNSGAYPTANHTVDVQGSFGAAITTTSTNLTLDDTHHTVIVTSGTPTITLPAAASGNSRRIYVIVNQTGSGVTISSYLDFTGAGNTTVAANSAIQIQSNGTNWYRIL